MFLSENKKGEKKREKIEVEIPKIVGRESKEEIGKGYYQKTVLLLNKALEQRSEEQLWIAVLSNLTFLRLTGLGSNLLRFPSSLSLSFLASLIISCNYRSSWSFFDSLNPHPCLLLICNSNFRLLFNFTSSHAAFAGD